MHLSRLFLLAVPFAGLTVLPAAELDVEHATIANIHAAYQSGALTVAKLTQIYLARIAAYDQQGPKINAVITLNPKAEAEAQAMERAAAAAFAEHDLDAIIFPTSSRPAALIAPPPGQAAAPIGGAISGSWVASGTGFPELVVPAGMSSGGLPISISFLGTAFSEPKILGYGYDFEQATTAIAVPKFTPVLAGDVIAR